MLVDHTFHVFGHEIRLRILPNAFVKDVSSIANLIASGHFIVARDELGIARRRWGECEEFLRFEGSLRVVRDRQETLRRHWDL
jgi:hypothetical protein